MSTTAKVFIGVAAALLLGGVTVFVVGALGESEETFCNADGLIGPDGELFGRDGGRNCQFVDEDGDLVERFGDGRPLCYAVASEGDALPEYGSEAVDCEDPGPGRVAKAPG